MRRTIYGLALYVLSAGIPAVAGNWNVPTTAKNIQNPVNLDAATVASAREVYRKHCVECHGIQGAGDGTKNRVDYDLRTIMASLTDGELYWKITHGVGKMPSYAGALTDDERWLVIHHLRSLSVTLPAAKAP